MRSFSRILYSDTDQRTSESAPRCLRATPPAHAGASRGDRTHPTPDTSNLYTAMFYSRHLTSVCFSHSPLETDMARDTQSPVSRNPHAVSPDTATPLSRTRNVCARRRRPLPFASPARKRPGVRHRRPHVALPRCFPCARIIAFRFEPLCSQAAQHLESGLRQHPCDLDAISIVSSSRAHGHASRVGLEALLASLCVRLRAVRRHGEPRQQHLLA